MSQPTRGLGTFAGVFTPSVLTILGIILFLRTGFVVGAAGLVGALVMIVLANAISVLTSLSLSAIATNLRVKGGGDYYVISRTLGVEYGGALGIVLFLAQSVSIAFYAIGFGEAVAAIAPGPSWLPQAVAAMAVAALFVLAWLGSDWATRFQYVVMTVLVLALTAFFIGGLRDWSSVTAADNLGPVELSNLSFWVVFAIFFPAVTGFTQGVSMSGDLRDPVKSLPLGTFGAVGLSFVVYLAVAIVFAGALGRADLIEDYGAMRRVSLVPWLVDAGVIAATLSSALASFMGAPRILQSLAADKVFPILNPFARGHGESNNPRRGVLFSLVLALATVALGNLNLIAPIVSMFFLISYGLLNYATYYEASANSPSFRPRFRWYHRRLSLLGAVGCAGVMLAINPTAAVVSIVLLWGILQYVQKNVNFERWADSGRARRFQRVREDLHAISGELDHARDWRPVILAFSAHDERLERILRFAYWLEGKSGFTTAVRIEAGSGAEARQRHAELEKQMRTAIARTELPAFAKPIVAKRPEQVLPVLFQAHGLGRVRANTALFNWSDRDKPRDGRTRVSVDELRQPLRYNCNLIMLSAGEKEFARVADTPRGKHRIDVWYRQNPTGKLMLLLAYLMTRSESLDGARIRLLVTPGSDQDPAELLEEMRAMLDEVRIEAELTSVEAIDAMRLVEHSHDASVSFVPFRIGADGPQSVAGEPLSEIVGPMGIVAWTLAAQEVDLEGTPESGLHAEIAGAVDAARATLRSAEKARREAEAAEKAVEDLGDEAGEELREKARQTRRRAAKAEAKARAAREEAEKLLGRPLDDDTD